MALVLERLALSTVGGERAPQDPQHSYAEQDALCLSMDPIARGTSSTCSTMATFVSVQAAQCAV